jgi:hypothetical protein
MAVSSHRDQGRGESRVALERLRECELPLIVFGSSVSEQDRHLTDALNEHPERPIAVSMLPGPKRDLAIRQADIYGRLKAEDLVFFDASMMVGRY